MRPPFPWMFSFGMRCEKMLFYVWPESLFTPPQFHLLWVEYLVRIFVPFYVVVVVMLPKTTRFGLCRCCCCFFSCWIIKTCRWQFLMLPFHSRRTNFSWCSKGNLHTFKTSNRTHFISIFTHTHTHSLPSEHQFHCKHLPVITSGLHFVSLCVCMCVCRK